MAGYWLDPKTGQCVRVTTTHDEWIPDRQHAEDLGLPEAAYREIMSFAPTNIDPIRLVAVRCGLVRIREHRRYVSVQYISEADRVGLISDAVAIALTDLGIHPDTRLIVDNFLLGESVAMTLAGLDTPPCQKHG
jgi:hypothetical protein